jgi:hypothetical protein
MQESAHHCILQPCAPEVHGEPQSLCISPDSPHHPSTPFHDHNRSWDLDGARETERQREGERAQPHSNMGTFQDVSLEHQRSPAVPDLSVCVLQVNGGAWDMSRCQIAGAGTGFHCEALVLLGGEVAPPANSSLRACNAPGTRSQKSALQ